MQVKGEPEDLDVPPAPLGRTARASSECYSSHERSTANWLRGGRALKPVSPSVKQEALKHEILDDAFGGDEPYSIDLNNLLSLEDQFKRLQGYTRGLMDLYCGSDEERLNVGKPRAQGWLAEAKR